MSDICKALNAQKTRLRILIPGQLSSSGQRFRLLVYVPRRPITQNNFDKKLILQMLQMTFVNCIAIVSNYFGGEVKFVLVAKVNKSLLGFFRKKYPNVSV